MWHNLLEEGTFTCRPGRWAFLLLWLLFTCFCFLRASTITTLRQRDGATVRLLRRKCLLLNIYQSAMVRTGRVLSAPVAPQKSSADELHESHCDVACGVGGRKMAPNRQSSLPEFENEKKKKQSRVAAGQQTDVWSPTVDAYSFVAAASLQRFLIARLVCLVGFVCSAW